MESSLDNGRDIIVYSSATEGWVHIRSTQVGNVQSVHNSILLPENKHQLGAYCYSLTDVTVRELENLWKREYIYLPFKRGVEYIIVFPPSKIRWRKASDCFAFQRDGRIEARRQSVINSKPILKINCWFLRRHHDWQINLMEGCLL